MPEASLPPPSLLMMAAAGGGFGGAILGVVVATMLMGADGTDAQAANEATEKPAVEVVVAER